MDYEVTAKYIMDEEISRIRQIVINIVISFAYLPCLPFLPAFHD